MPQGLCNLALVCRAWYAIVEPALYTRLRPTDGALRTPLRQSVARHARKITIRSARHSIISTRVAKVSLRPSPAVELQWVGSDRKEDRIEAAYHPSHATVCAQVHRSYSNVVVLNLRHCNFLSSLDLLRLLAAFSALERVSLRGVSVSHVSEAAWRCSSAGPLQSIAVNNECTPSQLPFLTHYLTGPHARSHDERPAFHGLTSAERQLVARICRLFASIRSADYHFNGMDKEGIACAQLSPLTAIPRLTEIHAFYVPTGVAWVDTTNLHIEFHSRQDSPQHPDAARIYACVLRVHGTGNQLEHLKTKLAELGKILSRLAFLEIVVLETGYNLTVNEIPSLLESLHDTCRVEVRHRACEEAHKLVLQARKSPSRSTVGSLLSSVWCLQKHSYYWRDW